MQHWLGLDTVVEKAELFEENKCLQKWHIKDIRNKNLESFNYLQAENKESKENRAFSNIELDVVFIDNVPADRRRVWIKRTAQFSHWCAQKQQAAPTLS